MTFLDGSHSLCGMANRREPLKPDVDRLLNRHEVAEILGVPWSWVRDKSAKHEIPHTRIGRHVRFTPEDVAAIIAAGKAAPIERRKAV